MSYVNNQSPGWGQNQRIADSVDHIASKIELSCDMISNAGIGLDSLHQELMMIANQPYPPQPSQLTSLATRILTSRKQMDDGVLKIKELARTIDSETNEIQKRAW